MRRKFNRTQRNYIIAGLCMILVIMGVGYAAFSSQLKISGTSNIASNFLVKITGIEVSSQSGGAADKPDVTTYNDTSATFGTTLQSPGDSIIYDITIENQGTIDAVLKTISKTDASNSAILFETLGVNEGDPLNVGETATMQVKVTYNPSVTSQPGDLNSTLKVDLTYEQGNGSIVEPGGETTTIGGQEVEVVSSGDGLYADEYEPGKYTYKGANPNNYITFNNETWRIISVESDNSLKIMRNTSVLAAWDTNNQNNWETASLNTYLNGEYLNSLSDKDKIVNRDWSVGAIIRNNNDLASQIADEKSTTWNGKIGLISSSEYIRANSNSNQCGTYKLDYDNYKTSLCSLTNWMYDSIPDNGGLLWTITPISGETNQVNIISDNTNGMYGLASSVGTNTDGLFSVCQALYLSSDINLSGDGSASNPYVITN